MTRRLSILDCVANTTYKYAVCGSAAKRIRAFLDTARVSAHGEIEMEQMEQEGIQEIQGCGREDDNELVMGWKKAWAAQEDKMIMDREEPHHPVSIPSNKKTYGLGLQL